ncbi:hypothetical protein [Thiohalorhabdus sp.]|uniref:hypothetical protein n=1 Tax=Thiohalorhabdus sp. TaxID=3094134 RepID=UPI002FC3D25F
MAMVLVAAATTVQARAPAHRQRRTGARAAIDRHIEQFLGVLKADYCRGNHYGRQGLESSWRWRNALASRATRVRGALAAEDRVASEAEGRRMLALRIAEAVTADPHRVFDSPQPPRSDLGHSCRLMLEEYGWTVVAPPPECLRTVDLPTDSSGTAAFLRPELISQPPSQSAVDGFAGEVAGAVSG